MNELVMKRLITSGIDSDFNRKLIEIGALGYQLDTIQEKIDIYADRMDTTMMLTYEKEYKQVKKQLDSLIREII